MKKIIAFLLLIVCFILSACSSVDLEYYMDTNVPTFTCVTKIEASKKDYVSSTGTYVYVYSCDSSEQDKYITQYTDYLKKEHNFAVVESNDNYDMVTLAKEGAGVLISIADSQTIHIMPYKRSA